MAYTYYGDWQNTPFSVAQYGDEGGGYAGQGASKDWQGAGYYEQGPEQQYFGEYGAESRPGAWTYGGTTDPNAANYTFTPDYSQTLNTGYYSPDGGGWVSTAPSTITADMYSGLDGYQAWNFADALGGYRQVGNGSFAPSTFGGSQYLQDTYGTAMDQAYREQMASIQNTPGAMQLWNATDPSDFYQMDSRTWDQLLLPALQKAGVMNDAQGKAWANEYTNVAQSGMAVDEANRQAIDDEFMSNVMMGLMLTGGVMGAGALGAFGSGGLGFASPAYSGMAGMESALGGMAGIEGAAGAGALGSASGGLNLSGYGTAFDGGAGSALTGADYTGAAGAMGGAGDAGAGAAGAMGGMDPTSAMGAMGGAGDVTAGAGYGWTPMTGYGQAGGLLQSLGLGGMPSNPLSSLQNLLGGGGAGGAGGTSSMSSLLSGLLGGGGGGLMPGGAGGAGGGGSLGGLLGSMFSATGFGDTQDYLKQIMERASQTADPYARYRSGDGDMLQQSYRDPLSIFQGSGYQALDKRLQDTMMARDAASGNLFNAPERLAQREAGFMDYNKDLQKNLITSSGAGFNPASSAAVMQGMAPSIALAGMQQQGAYGTAAQQGLGLLGGLLGGGGTGATGGGGGFDLNSIANFFGGGGGGSSSPLDSLWNTWNV